MNKIEQLNKAGVPCAISLNEDGSYAVKLLETSGGVIKQTSVNSEIEGINWLKLAARKFYPLIDTSSI